jgi:hypothetical protein
MATNPTHTRDKRLERLWNFKLLRVHQAKHIKERRQDLPWMMQPREDL